MVRITLRLDEELHAYLAVSAVREHRSLNSEIVSRLEHTLDLAPTGKTPRVLPPEPRVSAGEPEPTVVPGQMDVDEVIALAQEEGPVAATSGGGESLAPRPAVEQKLTPWGCPVYTPKGVKCKNCGRTH